MFTYSQSCHILHVSRSTLRRWLVVSELTPRRDPMERRHRLLSSAQIAKLAKAHQRVIMVPVEVKRLESRVAELERLLSAVLEERR